MCGELKREDYLVINLPFFYVRVAKMRWGEVRMSRVES